MKYHVRRDYPSPAKGDRVDVVDQGRSPDRSVSDVRRPAYAVRVFFPGVHDAIRAGVEGVEVVRFALYSATGREVERIDADPVQLLLRVACREEVADVILQVLCLRGSLSRTVVIFEGDQGPEQIHPPPDAPAAPPARPGVMDTR